MKFAASNVTSAEKRSDNCSDSLKKWKATFESLSIEAKSFQDYLCKKHRRKDLPRNPYRR